MQEYLRTELARLAEKPGIHSWLAGVRERKGASGRHLSTKAILEMRGADRR
jgi:hypothetical protein